MKKNICCVTGFGWSGSGALLDLLREYHELNIIGNNGGDWEFYLLHDTDGIYDLELGCVKKYNRIASYIPVLRFQKLIHNYCKYLNYEQVFKNQFRKISEDYIDSLVDFEFDGGTFYELFALNKLAIYYNKVIHVLFGNFFARKILGNKYLNLRIRNKSRIRVVYRPSNFLELTKKYLNRLFDILDSGEGKTMVIDQIFPPDSPIEYMKYVEKSKCIVVRRDPRDTYLLSKCAYNSEIPIPTANVADFICFYKKVVEETKIVDNPNILNIRFEDLIYNYEETKSIIEKFLGLKDHNSPLRYFDPQKSINNTQLHLLYTNFADDISRIEKELPNSLYPFVQYPFKRTDNIVF